MTTIKEPSLADLLVKSEDEKIAALPLEFEHIPVQILSKEFTKLNSKHPYRIHYLGPRPINSYILHKKYCNGEEPFDGIITHPRYQLNLRKIVNSSFINEKLQNNHYYRSAMFYRAFEGMNPSLSLKEEFVFNSAFQSGNLDCVIKVKEFEFDLFLRIDSNTRGHTSWYYFSVKNGHKTGKVLLHICNLTKSTQLYEQGMRPFTFVRSKQVKSGLKWHQANTPCTFEPAQIRYEIVNERKNMLPTFRLSFEVDFEETDDEIFFAYAIPYTYSQLWSDLNALPRDLVTVSVLAKSLTGVDIPIFSVKGELSDRPKKNIVLTARAHPGQSNGSYLLKGFIEALCSTAASELRKRANFFIVPMLNPDGVIMGNSRTSAAGKDLNREFHTRRRQLYPEVTALKGFVGRLQRTAGIFLYCDFHGHSRKKNTFLYGPSYSLGDAEYYRCRVLPRLIERVSSRFRYYSCSFVISESKRTTARAVMLQQFRIPYSYTIQSSVGLFYDQEAAKTCQFIQETWQAMGAAIQQGLAQFLAAYEQHQITTQLRKMQREKARDKNKNIKKFAQDQVPQENIFETLIQEVKENSPKCNPQIELSSDQHDCREDLEAFKLAEFNNLIIQNTLKEAVYNPKYKEQEQFDPSQMHRDVEEESQNERESPKQKISSSIRKYIPSSQVKKIKDHPKLIRSPTPILSELMTTQRQIHKKNFVLENKERYNIATKNLFALEEKCEIVELPRTIKHIRKELKKGRELINSLWDRKMKESPLEMFGNLERQQNKSVKLEQQFVNFKFLDESKMLPQRLDFTRTSHSFRKIRKSSSLVGKIHESDPYEALSNVQIDNLAMTIKTYQKRL